MNVRHPGVLLLIAFVASACGPRTAPALPDGLTIEEHALRSAPELEPFGFDPVDGTMDAALARHSAERARTFPEDSLLIDGEHAIRATLDSDVLTATEHYDSATASSWVTLTRGDEQIYRIDAGIPSPIPGLQGLWTYDGHWVLETDYMTQDAYGGKLTLDGVLLNESHAYSEAFDFQLLGGKPFYFFKRDGRIGFAYNGQETDAGFDNVPHYQCCSGGVLNPRHAENMVAFFGQRAGAWYYVEIGLFGD